MQPPKAPAGEAGASGSRSRELGSLLEIFVAPGRAFETIRERMPWRIAFVVIVLCNLIVLALMGPIEWHVNMVTSPEIHALSQGEILRSEREYYLSTVEQLVVSPLLASGMIAVVLTFATAKTILEGRRLVTFFSLAVTATVPNAVGEVVAAVVQALRPADSYASLHQIVLAFPDSLAVFVPNANDPEIVFLSPVDIFLVWTTILIALGYAKLTGSSIARACALSFGCALAVQLGVLLPALLQ